MKNIQAIKLLLKKNRKSLQEQFNIKSLGIFGSYSRGNSSPRSDIDMLVKFSRVPTMFQFIELERKLSRMLGIKVDLVTPNALKPLIKKDILEETIFI